MRTSIALVASALLVAGCAHNFRVSRTEDPRFVSVPITAYDKPSIGWAAHSSMIGVSVVTLISPSDWVPRESVRLIRSEDANTICYSVVPRPGATPGLPPVPVRFTFMTDAIKRSDKRAVFVSKSCDRKT